jgi:hypothetical protein
MPASPPLYLCAVGRLGGFLSRTSTRVISVVTTPVQPPPQGHDDVDDDDDEFISARSEPTTPSEASPSPPLYKADVEEAPPSEPSSCVLS